MELCEEGVYKKMYTVLLKYKIEDLKVHALRVFPEMSWIGVTGLITQVREEIKLKTVAVAIVEIAKKLRLENVEIKKRLEILKLKATCLTSTNTWYAYELNEKYPDHHNIDFPQIQNSIQSVVHSPVIAVRAPFDFDSILLGIKQSRKLITVCLTRNYLFLYQRLNNNLLLETIANGLGYKSTKDCFLSGAHIPSLLQILNQKKGADSLGRICTKSVSKCVPRRTPFGLDFTNTSNIQDQHEKRKDGNDVSQLQKLTLHTKVQCNSATTYSRVEISTSDIESSLCKMAEANIIPANAFFFSMLRDHCKNEMKLNISTPFVGN